MPIPIAESQWVCLTCQWKMPVIKQGDAILAQLVDTCPNCGGKDFELKKDSWLEVVFRRETDHKKTPS